MYLYSTQWFLFKAQCVTLVSKALLLKAEISHFGRGEFDMPKFVVHQILNGHTVEPQSYELFGKWGCS